MAAIIDSSDDAIVGKSPDGLVASWNPAAERMFGFRSEEIVGRPIALIVPPELIDEEREIMARVSRGERVEHYESVRQHRDGSRLDVALTVSPIRSEAGDIIGASNILRDITRRRREMDAMRLLAAIVESSDDAIVSKDLNGVVTSWNRGAERVFGYTAEEMIGRPIATVFPSDRQDEEPQILRRLRRGERIDHFHTVRRRKDGRFVDVSVTISPIRNDAGEVIGASKVARDITQEKLALTQLARANEELMRADRMKSEFLATMSHELRTPLNSILGFASLLLQPRSGQLTDEQRKHIGLIHASGKHLLGLINDLLDLSRIEAGRAEIQCEVFSPGEAVMEAIRTLEPQAVQKKLRVLHTIDVNARVHSDRQRFYQVVLNLLNNAIKFTARGTIELRAAMDGDRYVVSVADTGIGIAPERQGELFKPFSQLEGSARRRFEGTGLGLYLCKKLLALLGGDIGVTSEPARGSVFTFWIPVRPPENGPTGEPATFPSA